MLSLVLLQLECLRLARAPLWSSMVLRAAASMEGKCWLYGKNYHCRRGVELKHLRLVGLNHSDPLQPVRPLGALSFLLAVLENWFEFLRRNLALTPVRGALALD